MRSKNRPKCGFDKTQEQTARISQEHYACGEIQVRALASVKDVNRNDLITHAFMRWLISPHRSDKFRWITPFVHNCCQLPINFWVFATRCHWLTNKSKQCRTNGSSSSGYFTRQSMSIRYFYQVNPIKQHSHQIAPRARNELSASKIDSRCENCTCENPFNTCSREGDGQTSAATSSACEDMFNCSMCLTHASRQCHTISTLIK